MLFALRITVCKGKNITTMYNENQEGLDTSETKQMKGQETEYLRFNFRFPVEQVGKQGVVVKVPRGNGAPVLHSDFMQVMQLSDKEIRKAEVAALRSIAIIEE